MKPSARLKISRFSACLLALAVSSTAIAGPPELTPRQYEQLSKLGSALQEEHLDQVFELGYPLLKRPRGNQEQRAFVRAFVARVLAQAYQQQDDLDAAVAILERSLGKAEYLDHESLQALRWLLVQMRVTQADYEEALALLNLWWEVEESPDAQAYYLHAALLGQLERWSEAEPWLLQALELQTSPPDSWLALAVAIYQNQEHWQEAADYQARRLDLNPERPRLWVQLAQLQKLAGENEEALVTQELAKRRGYLSTRETERLARELLQADQPLRAAKVFEALIAENEEVDVLLLRLSAQAWLQTRRGEDIASSLERLARFSEQAADWQRLADWHFSQGEWREALDAWTQARPGLEAPERARVELLMANAHLELENYSEARYLLEELLDSSQETAARQWLNYLDALN